jgi:hypothetical protein
LYQYQRERYFDVVNGRLLLRVETDEWMIKLSFEPHFHLCKFHDKLITIQL